MKTHIDLFSGIGGFALAAHWAGFTTEVFCERDVFCQRVLRYHWPAVPIVSDIREFDGSAYRGADLLTGGFPCQPFSTAGKRGGAADDRFLWPEMLRVISEARPRWVVAENVPGIISMALDDVLSDLENEGYEVGTVIIPACGVNAPHRRDRVWIVAHRQRTGTRMEEHRNSGQGWEFADSLEPAILRQENRATGAERNHANRAVVAHTCRDEYQRKNRGWIDQTNGVSEIHRTDNDASRRIGGASSIRESCSSNVSDSDRSGWEEHGGRCTVEKKYTPAKCCRPCSFCGYEFNHDLLGKYGCPNCYGEGLEPESDLGERDDGLPGRLAGYWDGDWERGIPRVCGKVPDRAPKLKALGNAIVPQVAYEILRMIQQVSES